MPSAAILAGGHASRFGGRDKSALVVGGRTILERQLSALAGLTDDIMIVGHIGYRAPPDTRGAGTARAVPDRAPGSGPLGGLDAALAAARHDRVIVLACDMPFVTAALMAHLIAIAEGSDVVVPRTERGYHPLCAVYSRACGAVVSRRLAEGRLAIRGVLDEVRVRVVTGEELDAFGDRNRLLANVNTPAEYEELETLHGHHR
jgi:molybdopterin-guanine dinucleotide biosynthesis protein A